MIALMRFLDRLWEWCADRILPNWRWDWEPPDDEYDDHAYW